MNEGCRMKVERARSPRELDIRCATERFNPLWGTVVSTSQEENEKSETGAAVGG